MSSAWSSLSLKRAIRRGFRLVLGADDADHFVEVEERDQQAFEHVQAAFDLLEPVAAAGA